MCWNKLITVGNETQIIHIYVYTYIYVQVYGCIFPKTLI